MIDPQVHQDNDPKRKSSALDPITLTEHRLDQPYIEMKRERERGGGERGRDGRERGRENM